MHACVALGGHRRPTVELIVGEGRLAERRELLVDLAWLSYRARVMWCVMVHVEVCVCVPISARLTQRPSPETSPSTSCLGHGQGYRGWMIRLYSIDFPYIYVRGGALYTDPHA